MTKETLTKANDINSRLSELKELKARLDFNNPSNAEKNAYLFFSGQTCHEAVKLSAVKLSANMERAMYGLVSAEICELEAEFEAL